MKPIFPSSWLGILGGGQLGRYFTQAAQDLGYSVCVLDPDEDSPAGKIAQKFIKADYLDEDALKQFANICVAASTEFENVPAKVLDWLSEQNVFVAPMSKPVSIAQSRTAEKGFLSKCSPLTGIKTAPYCMITSSEDCKNITEDMFPAILKTTRLGYDGKGQRTIKEIRDLEKFWTDLGQVECVLEKKLDLAFEVSAIVARAADNEVAIFPVAQNEHRNGILHLSVVPAPLLSHIQEQEILEATKKIICELDYVGVLCVEYFVLRDGQIIVNEIAPRPHNSGHHTLDSCFTSQFEQQVRTLARLPLGQTTLTQSVVMLNLLGDIWFDENQKLVEPPWDQVLAIPSAKLHLYGKTEPKLARKMGHINFLADNIQLAMADAKSAMEILGIPSYED
jgi:5-(carboxyamino)imidazole ribonucleotide synthase